MSWVDLIIVIVLAASVFGGLSQGFFRSVCSLAGLILGLAMALWNYGRVATMLMPLVHIWAIADAIGFLLIALVVMAIAGIAGAVLHGAVHEMGLGFVDRILGAGFGFVQGVVMITLCILVIVAFFPEAQWLTHARLPRMFFGACHLSEHMSPAELAARVREGLSRLELESPKWMHS
jgi:membrane protein required for colicin V production